MEKIKYKILRDRERRPTVTICEIRSNGYIGRGIALRSAHDNPVEKIGKIKAYGRAKKALYRRENSMPIYRAGAFWALSCVDLPNVPLYKSQFIDTVYQNEEIL